MQVGEKNNNISKVQSINSQLPASKVTPLIVCLTGVSPQLARGSKTGVFIGCSASESHDAWSNNTEDLVGYEMTGCTRSMFANRLSYFFDFKGVCV